jgi:tryptophan synthase beta subunit
MTPERDSISRAFPVQAIDVAVLTADNVPPAVDLKNTGACMLALSIGVGGITFTGANKIEFVLTHSDDNVTYTNVTDDDVLKDALAPTTITTGIIRSLTALKAAADVQKLAYVGGKRYIKLLADFSGTHATGTPISAVAIRSRASISGTA